ncbi:rCG21975, partial [Rattus norvegicus]
MEDLNERGLYSV